MYCCRLFNMSGWLCRKGAKMSAWCWRYSSVNDSLDQCPIILTTSNGTLLLCIDCDPLNLASLDELW